MKNYDVFISYSSEDKKIVEGLCAYLEQHKIRCFVAYRDIPYTTPWASAIVTALESSKMMLAVYSKDYNESDQTDREIEIASEEKLPILTFRITKEAFQGTKKYYLKNLNWIDAFPEPEKVFGKVTENVIKLVVEPETDPEPEIIIEHPVVKKDSVDELTTKQKWIFVVFTVFVGPGVVAAILLCLINVVNKWRSGEYIMPSRVYKRMFGYSLIAALFYCAVLL